MTGRNVARVEIPTGVEASLNFLQVEHNLPRGECEDVM